MYLGAGTKLVAATSVVLARTRATHTIVLAAKHGREVVGTNKKK